MIGWPCQPSFFGLPSHGTAPVNRTLNKRDVCNLCFRAGLRRWSPRFRRPATAASIGKICRRLFPQPATSPDDTQQGRPLGVVQRRGRRRHRSRPAVQQLADVETRSLPVALFAANATDANAAAAALNLRKCSSRPCNAQAEPNRAKTPVPSSLSACLLGSVAIIRIIADDRNLMLKEADHAYTN